MATSNGPRISTTLTDVIPRCTTNIRGNTRTRHPELTALDHRGPAKMVVAEGQDA